MSFIQFATALVVLIGAAFLVYEAWRACASHASEEDEHATQHHGPGLPHHRRKR